MSPQRILVIDDNQLTLQVTKDLLEKDGYEVITTASGFDVGKLLTAGSPPALMLVDVAMPHINGDALVRILKTNAVTREIPIYLYSSRSADELQAMVETSGADGYFCKTITQPDLLAEIRRLLD